MPMSEDQRAQALRETLATAIALAEDIEHIRELLDAESRDPDARAVRHLSGVMRPLLVDNNGDLRKVAPPRVGRVMLRAPDVKPYVDWVKPQGFRFFAAGGPAIRDITWPTFSFGGGRPFPSDWENPPDIHLTLDGFLHQPVLCSDGLWIDRHAVIT